MAGLSRIFRNGDEIAQGISIMAGRILVDSLPATIEELVDSHGGFVVVARLLERGAREGFTWLMKRLGIDSSNIELDQVLGIFIDNGDTPSHPFQAFESIQSTSNGYVLETSNCPYADKIREHLSTMGVFVGVVAGVISALGYRVRWLATPSSRKYLCKSEKPDIIVYMDDKVSIPACRLIVEKYSCREGD